MRTPPLGQVVHELVAAVGELVEREHVEVGDVARRDHAAPVEAEHVGLATGELVDRVLEREVAALAHVAREQQRRVARRAHHLHVRAGVGRADQHGGVLRACCATPSTSAFAMPTATSPGRQSFSSTKSASTSDG